MSLPDDFKSALSTWASGVSIVTAEVQGRCWGLTASSFTSLSLDPPLIIICLGSEARLTAPLLEARHFGVSLLAREQEAVSNHFASKGLPPSEDLGSVASERLDCGRVVVEGAVAQLGCELYSSIVQGDHHIIVGRVVEARSFADRKPLIYQNRAYRGVTGE